MRHIKKDYLKSKDGTQDKPNRPPPPPIILNPDGVNGLILNTPKMINSFLFRLLNITTRF